MSGCKNHLKFKHQVEIAESSHLIHQMMTQKPRSRPIDQEECLLCRQKPATTKRSFLKHVGRHMEDIALMALPVADDGSENEDSDDNEDSQISLEEVAAQTMARNMLYGPEDYPDEWQFLEQLQGRIPYDIDFTSEAMSKAVEVISNMRSGPQMAKEQREGVFGGLLGILGILHPTQPILSHCEHLWAKIDPQPDQHQHTGQANKDFSRTQLENDTVPIPSERQPSESPFDGQQWTAIQKPRVTSGFGSVQEMTDFPQYVKHLGTDFQEIAVSMGTKTQQMIQNHYFRETDAARGKSGRQLQEYAKVADGKRYKDRKLGPLPTPFFPNPWSPKELDPNTIRENPKNPTSENLEDTDETFLSGLREDARLGHSSPWQSYETPVPKSRRSFQVGAPKTKDASTVNAPHSDWNQSKERIDSLKPIQQNRSGHFDNSVQPTSTRKMFFVPVDDIDKNVIEQQVRLMLGKDAEVSHWKTKGHLQYMIRAEHPFTNDQLEDLKAMSKDHQAGKRRGSHPDYTFKRDPVTKQLTQVSFPYLMNQQASQEYEALPSTDRSLPAFKQPADMQSAKNVEESDFEKSPFRPDSKFTNEAGTTDSSYGSPQVVAPGDVLVNYENTEAVLPSARKDVEDTYTEKQTELEVTFVCKEPGCEDLPGFTNNGDLGWHNLDRHGGGSQSPNANAAIPVWANNLSGAEAMPGVAAIDEHPRGRFDAAPVLPTVLPIKKNRRCTAPEKATYECRVCGKLFKRSYNWKSHMETHNPDRKYPHPCTAQVNGQQCSKKFQRKSDLERHYDSVHLKAKNHCCNLCGIRFAHRDTLRRHTEDGCPKRFGIWFSEDNNLDRRLDSAPNLIPRPQEESGEEPLGTYPINETSDQGPFQASAISNPAAVPPNLIPKPREEEHKNPLTTESMNEFFKLPVVPEAWNPESDRLLLQLRSHGYTWQSIASDYIRDKTPYACRKRWERLMERYTPELDPLYRRTLPEPTESVEAYASRSW
ncbi:uncharacterized protein KY384_004605 [Bacidia gigantensis]|uniref:uncharacterized protein n=1 Tax=Bacidia gigantensis TaxID=2732470 RepID=UPI001D049448|nr:uncharacterized protein KY384_004605 [Bacidia gigantensis]KAG8531247.1 hypothetical protein KY384_004605 [Bacidia gigantensis]